MARDAEGRVTVRAVRISEPPRIDGVLDEELYGSLPPITDFIQQEPNEGQIASEPGATYYDREQISPASIAPSVNR